MLMTLTCITPMNELLDLLSHIFLIKISLDRLKSFCIPFMSTTTKLIDNGRCKFGFGCKKKKNDPWTKQPHQPLTKVQLPFLVEFWSIMLEDLVLLPLHFFWLQCKCGNNYVKASNDPSVVWSHNDEKEHKQPHVPHLSCI